MKKVEYQKLEFDVNKFPHLLSVQERIEELTLFIEKLNLRKALINGEKSQGYPSGEKSEFQKNEDAILLIQTNWDLAKSHKNLAEKTKYAKEFTDRLIKYIDEVNEKFESVRHKAFTFLKDNNSSKNNEIVKALEVEFEQVKDTDLDENWEVRVKHYIVLKSIFEAPKKTK
jgi:flagellar hook-basal body complex protein FliE